MFQVTQVLIDRREIQVNRPNTHGQIPLHLAAQNGHLELARMLVQAGSDLDFADLIGKSGFIFRHFYDYHWIRQFPKT